jgi:hypothetical protein
LISIENHGTALQTASARGGKEVVEILPSKGTDINMSGGVYSTALQAASAKGNK